jgi:hypothetical protein
MSRLVPLGLLIALTAFFAAAAAIAQHWVEYRPAGNDYRIEFPGKPTERSEPLHNGGSYVMAEYGNTDGAYYFATVNQISPAQMKLPPSELLDLIRDAQVNATKGKVRQEDSPTLDGAPARRLIIDAPGPIVTDVLLVVKGDRLYPAVRTVNASDDNRADAGRFFDSFAVLAK